MKKILSLILGGVLGAAVGAGLVTLFAPSSGKDFIANLKRSYAEALESARQASAQRRAELEAELAQMQSRRSE